MKNRKKGRYLPLLMLALMLSLLLGTMSVQAASLKLNKTNLPLTIGKTYTLKLKGAEKKPAWSSTKKSVATVNAKGVVKAVYPGTATIRAKYKGKHYSCKVTVKNANATAKALKFENADKGVFIKGVSKANISFKLNHTSMNVTAYVKSASGRTVYTKTYKTCKAGKTCKFVWNGKTNKGATVSEGTYTVVIKAGKTKTTSKPLTIRRQEFAGGTGSKNNPFLVASLAQFQNIPQYNGYYFKQTATIDGGGITTISGIFSSDNPFVGTYNGNGFCIQNLIIQDSSRDGIALFGGVGEKGVLRNVTMKKVNVFGSGRTAGLVRWNAGTVDGCTVAECTLTQSNHVLLGGLCDVNDEKGLLVNCTVTGCNLSLSGGGYGDFYMSGLCIDNFGKMLDCKINDTTIYYAQNQYISYMHASGIVQWNKGSVFNCHAVNTTISGKQKYYEERIGGLCVTNEGVISGSSFTGSASTQGCWNNKGVIL